MAAAYVGSLFVALQLSGVGGLTDEPAQAEPAIVAPTGPPPARPQSVPKRVPAWAWAMSRWHDDRVAGERPSVAPQVLPGWYWDWRAWRKQLGA